MEIRRTIRIWTTKEKTERFLQCILKYFYKSLAAVNLPAKHSTTCQTFMLVMVCAPVWSEVAIVCGLDWLPTGLTCWCRQQTMRQAAECMCVPHKGIPLCPAGTTDHTRTHIYLYLYYYLFIIYIYIYICWHGFRERGVSVSPPTLKIGNSWDCLNTIHTHLNCSLLFVYRVQGAGVWCPLQMFNAIC